MFIYPWGDMHSLNLGWFLLQFKEWVEKIQEYLDNGGGTSENLANVIAPVFNAANSYLTGDYVLYNDELYKALEPVPPGTWNPDAWARCLVTEEMGSSASGVDNVARLMIAGQYSNTYNYQKYAICRYADKLWMCNTNLPTGGEEWEPSHWDEITVGAGLTGLRRSVETLSQDIINLNGAINSIDSALAIVATGNTHVYIAQGRYVKVKGHSTLADGLYQASTNISANAPLTTSNLKAVTDGGFNAVGARAHYDIISNIDTNNTGTVSLDTIGKIAIVTSYIGEIVSGGASSGWVTVGSIPSGLQPSANVTGIAISYSGSGITKTYPMRVTSGGAVQIIALQNGDTGIAFTLPYIIA